MFLDHWPDIGAMARNLVKSDFVEQSDCTRLLVVDAANSSLPSPTKAHIMDSLLHMQHGQPAIVLSSLKRAKPIYDEVGCLISILGTDNYDISDLAPLTLGMKHHLVFKLGGRRPNAKELKLSDRPFIWIQQNPSVCD